YADAEVAFALAVTEHAAGTLVEVARLAIDRAPALSEALRAGRIDLPKLKIIATELDGVAAAECAGLVARLLPGIERCTGPQIREKLRRLVLRHDPQAAKKRHAKAVASRWVQHSESGAGTASLAAVCLPVDRAAAAWEHVDAIARATKAAGDPLQRNLDQLRADVFADLLAGIDPALAGAATPASRRGVISLHVGLNTLRFLDDEPGRIDGFGPVLADIARAAAEQMAQTARWRFVVHNDDGTVVAEGRLRYRPTLAQRQFVNARDETCRAPGCRRPSIRCDLDHIKDWARLGLTRIDNLACLCRRHHRAKHHGRYRVRRAPGGLEWITPQGRHYLVVPTDARLPDILIELDRSLTGDPAPIHLRH
ncbi:MAG: DUF222 domain-containing protein, partial [Acidimicrobiales bacterium]